jgi:AhpD family alkylhydroperoxidase
VSAVRIPFELAPDARDALRGLEKYLARSGLARELLELVKLRVSMINGCAFCVDMHWRNLRGAGESEQRLYSLAVWREQSGYSARERAALAWAESLTLVAATGVPDQSFAEVSAHFSAKEIADLSYAVAAINAWNRLCVAFRIAPAEPMPERE